MAPGIARCPWGPHCPFENHCDREGGSYQEGFPVEWEMASSSPGRWQTSSTEENAGVWGAQVAWGSRVGERDSASSGRWRVKKGYLQGRPWRPARRPEPRPGLGWERSQVWALSENQPGWSNSLLWSGARLLALSAAWTPGPRERAQGTQGAGFSVQPTCSIWP